MESNSNRKFLVRHTDNELYFKLKNLSVDQYVCDLGGFVHLCGVVFHTADLCPAPLWVFSASLVCAE